MFEEYLTRVVGGYCETWCKEMGTEQCRHCVLADFMTRLESCDSAEEKAAAPLMQQYVYAIKYGKHDWEYIMGSVDAEDAGGAVQAVWRDIIRLDCGDAQFKGRVMIYDVKARRRVYFYRT